MVKPLLKSLQTLLKPIKTQLSEHLSELVFTGRQKANHQNSNPNLRTLGTHKPTGTESFTTPGPRLPWPPQSLGRYSAPLLPWGSCGWSPGSPIALVSLLEANTNMTRVYWIYVIYIYLIYMCIYICNIHTTVCICIMYMSTCVHVCMCMYMCMCMCMCHACMYVRMYVRMYVCI